MSPAQISGAFLPCFFSHRGDDLADSRADPLDTGDPLRLFNVGASLLTDPVLQPTFPPGFRQLVSGALFLLASGRCQGPVNA